MRLRKKKPSQEGRRPSPEPRLSPKTYAYRSDRSNQKENTGRKLFRSQTGQNGWPKLLLQKFGLVILFVALAVCVVNVLILSRQPKIVLLSPDSHLYLHNADTYQKTAAGIMSSSFLNDNKITVDTSKISSQLLQKYPELTSASITLPLLAHRPVIYLSPAQPAVILVSSNGSFVLDNRGRALLRANSTANFTYLKVPIVVDKSGLKASLDELAVTSSTINFIQTVVYQLQAKHIGIGTISLATGGSELDVGIAGQPYFVKFNLQNNDPRQQAGTYIAAITRLQSQGLNPSQYIDVRVDGRAYYQ